MLTATTPPIGQVLPSAGGDASDRVIGAVGVHIPEYKRRRIMETSNTGSCVVHQVFNIFTTLGSISAVTWNARALFASRFVDFNIVRNNWNLVESLMSTQDVLLFQEVHGCRESVASLRTKAPGWKWFGSFKNSCAAAGLLIGVSPRLVGLADSIRITDIVPARLAKVSICKESSTVSFLNVHVVPKISQPDFRAFVRKIDEHMKK